MSNAQVVELWRKVKGRLEKVSPSMCLAKWKQSTIYLHTGFTHSCHHPISHKVSAEDVQTNPILLHNTPEKMEFRQQMLDGKRPSECDYCWRVEDLPGEQFSDRVQKSANSWSLDFEKEVLESGLGQNINPSYLEVMFENTCNFKCVYCFPDISSRIMEDIQQNGAFKLADYDYQDLSYLKKVGKWPIHRKEYNPYTEAFWKWWPDLYTTLRTFRITGGEPLLSDHTWRVLDYIIEHPNPELTFGINTNLGVPDKLINKLIEKLQLIQPKVKELQVFSSLEATECSAEYIRYGMVFGEWLANTDKVQRGLPDTLFTIMSTVNVLSYSTLSNFVELMRKMRADAKDKHKFHVSFNFLRYPEFLDIRLLPEKTKLYLAEHLNVIANVFCDWPRFKGMEEAKDILMVDECENLKRLLSYMMEPMPDEKKHLANLRAYLKEQDRRRKTDYTQLFPELHKHLEDSLC